MPAELIEHAPSDRVDPDAVYGSFVDWTTRRGLTLYPAQDEAMMELVSGGNVILATPTGSGKSLVAVGAHYAALRSGRRSCYTAPIKALVSEKFFALCEVFGAERVGMVTGDASVNPDAPIICATAEILANLALRAGARADIGLVVMDEFHYYADPDRGWAWQVPLLELADTQFLLMSATLGNVEFFVRDLARRTGRSTVVVGAGAPRPVPLMFSYARTPITETIADLVATCQAPIYVVHFGQAAALARAQALTSTNLCSRAEKDTIAEAIGDFRFSTGFGKTLSRLIRHGVGVHHAGMLPRYRRLVERLAQQGLLKVVSGTDTLGVGINVPIRTVLLTGLTKYDGVRTRRLKAREFHQIAGRAGRAGFDTVGTVVAQAPDHEVENTRLVAKAAGDPKKLKRVQRRKPPEGFVSWSEDTFDRLIAAEPEPMSSRFTVTNAMLLNVIARPGNCFNAMRHLLEDNHEPRPAQRRHILRAIRLYRALLNAGVVQQLPEPDADGRRARLTVELQRDFALDQPLSPFALAAFELLDRDSPSYTLDVVSLIESTLENPRPILQAQQRRARGEAISEMKAEGLDYDERMALIEDITWPTPLADLIEPAYETYLGRHPWLSDFTPSPKSVVRDMVERSMTFTELISEYDAARSEGLVLRYLADAYRALRRSVPEQTRTEELDDLTEWLGELVRQVDSSLLDEWEQLVHPDSGRTIPADVDRDTASERPISANTRSFRVMIRNKIFRLVQAAAARRYDELARASDRIDWESALAPYFAEYGRIDTGPDARGPNLFRVEPGSRFWVVRQVLADPAGDHGWSLDARIDVAASDTAGEIIVDELAVTAG